MLLLLLETSSVVDKKCHSLQLYYRRAPLYIKNFRIYGFGLFWAFLGYFGLFLGPLDRRLGVSLVCYAWAASTMQLPFLRCFDTFEPSITDPTVLFYSFFESTII